MTKIKKETEAAAEAAAEVNAPAIPPKSKFGIGADVQATRLGKFDAPIKEAGGWIFPTIYLVNVEVHEQEITKGANTGAKTKVLLMDFADAAKGAVQKKGLRVLFFPQDGDKEQTNLEAMQQSIKHIYEQHKTMATGEVLGGGAESYDKFFEMLAASFNAGNAGAPVYGNVPLFAKLTWYNGNLGFPRYPNFVERKTTEKPQTLTVNLQFDIVDQESTGTSSPVGGKAGSAPMASEFPV